MKKEEIVRLSDALQEANIEALGVYDGNDNGSCNFDRVCIRLDGWSSKDVQKASDLSHVGIGKKLTGYWKGFRELDTRMSGQGYRRTRMVEAAYKSLKSSGYIVQVYYQVD